MNKTCLLLAAAALCSCAHIEEQAFYVTGASIQEANRHQRLSRSFQSKGTHLSYDDKEFVITGHRIARGDGTVLAFRSYAPGAPLTMDQASFFKITVYLPVDGLKEGFEAKIPDPNGAMAFYSTGQSNFPGSGGCFGYASAGVVQVLDVSDTGVTIKADLQFHLSGPAGRALSDCEDKKVEAVYKAQPVRAQEITPWQGTAGKNIYEETIAR